MLGFSTQHPTVSCGTERPHLPPLGPAGVTKSFPGMAIVTKPRFRPSVSTAKSRYFNNLRLPHQTHTHLTTRRRFKCAACHHQFSVTSGTILASRKLSFVDLLGAICLLVNASKGLSAVQLSRDLDVQYKTAFVLMHKLRARAGVRCSPHQPFRRLQPRRRPHQSGGEFLCPAPAHGRRAAPQSWRPASWRLCCARRLVGGSSRSG